MNYVIILWKIKKNADNLKYANNLDHYMTMN